MLAVERRKRDLAIVTRYHAKVNDLLYKWRTRGKRKRGNPPSLIDAVARLVGGKECAQCGVLFNPQLHHINGNWRDYRLSNLQFLCSPCHVYADRLVRRQRKQLNPKEQRMAKIVKVNGKNQWLAANAEGIVPAQVLIEYVEQHPTRQVAPACRELSENALAVFGEELTAEQLEGTYYRVSRKSRHSTLNTPVRSQSYASNGSVQEKAIELVQLIKLLESQGFSVTYKGYN